MVRGWDQQAEEAQHRAIRRVQDAAPALLAACKAARDVLCWAARNYPELHHGWIVDAHDQLDAAIAAAEQERA